MVRRSVLWRNEFYLGYLLKNKQTKLKPVIKIMLIAILLLIINRNDGPPRSRKIEMEVQKTTLMYSQSILQKYYIKLFKVLTKKIEIYGRFNIGDEQAKYRLEVSSYSGTAGGDSLAYYNMTFTTIDRDSRGCAVQFTGAWWYNNCHRSNLNGKYLGNKGDDRGIRWLHFRDSLSLKFSEMKLSRSPSD